MSQLEKGEQIVDICHNVPLVPLVLQPVVGFGLSNNVPPFCPIYHQLSPSSHSQHLKISFYFFSPSSPGPSPSFHPFQFLIEDLFGHPILLHFIQVTQAIYLCPFIHFTIFSSLLISSSSWLVLLFHSPFSYLGPYSLLNIFTIMLDSLIVSICTVCYNADRIRESAKSGTKVFMWQEYHSYIGMNSSKNCGCESLAFLLHEK